jgi:hypothetical protein
MLALNCCCCSTLAKECFKGLALVLPEAFSDEQLAALWGAQLRYQQLGHVMLDPNPLLADSYSVFLKEVGGCRMNAGMI